MPVRPVVRALAWGAIGGAVFVGCTLDWTVRPDPVEAGVDATNRPDTSTETGSDATDGQVEDRRDSAVVDASCDAFFQNVTDKRREARLCTLVAGQCGEKVKELCDCDVFVAKKDSGQTATFQKAVADFNASGCNPNCTGCPGLPVVGGCVVMGADTICSP